MSQPQQAIKNALIELAERGYRDVTALVKPYYGGNYDYLCTLQKPNGEPAYCQSLQDVLAFLETARESREVRTAPEPSEAILWMLVGDFSDQLTKKSETSY